ncbi:MAG: hypothetical protein AAB776_00340 [Patescibacteria group bacterium]
MKKDSVKERLRWANDQCPLPGSPIPSLHHTRWYAEAHSDEQKRLWRSDGFTTIVLQSRFLSWYRSFTVAPPKPSSPHTVISPSFITIHEWLPRYEPKPQAGWFIFGSNYTSAYAQLHENYLDDWRSHAQRHLKIFKKSGCTLRLGTKADVATLYTTSQVPKSLQVALLKTLDKHLAVHPDTIDILVAEKNGRAIACHVAGNCDEAGLSEYIIGAFHPDYKKENPMVGLVDWWYKRSLERGYKTLTFGHMEPPASKLPSTGNGYSFFKTHFGVERIWFPKNRWKFYFNHKVLFSRT